jgi:trans-aconitate 2-methyltransferase
VPKGERKSLKDVIEDTRLSPRWAGYSSPSMIRISTSHPSSMAFLPNETDSVFFAHILKPKPGIFNRVLPSLGSVTFIEWTQHLPEGERLDFVKERA